MSGFFSQAYLEAVAGTSLIPASEDDLKILLETFLLEKALVHLNFEMKNRPARALAPMRIIRSLMKGG